ncbi:T-cell surface glycoprotein CD3 epsilon chain [Rana temporaria]|uniref:T-cell surface glycoprotein CD3 epsilon chain n=1 Tax=Rana temporaria TaxID=8407 RepID=UPI001AAD424E|nr:T-cell surface glycoprotein CD3 epsilon chain [Rana temporaria]
MKMQFLLSFLLAWLCVGISPAEGDSSTGDITSYKYKVEISGRSVTITCPPMKENEEEKKKEERKLTKKGKAAKLDDDGSYKKENFSADDNGDYECGSGRHLYLKAYVCDTCIEVSVLVVAGILIADCLVTLGVSLLIYFGRKKKSARSSEMAPGGRNRGNKERPPPVPHPDYEPLQKRGQVVYDGLNKHFK